MTGTRKHSPTYASGLSGTGIPSSGKFLCGNDRITVYTMNDLPERQARIYSRVINETEGLQWKVFILTDDTLQNRSGLKSGNVQGFSRGQGLSSDISGRI